MKRSIALISIALLGMFLFGATVLTPPAQAQIKLSYANFPPAITFPCVQMERWKTEVEKRTAGKVKVDTYPGGTLLTARNMFDGVIAGTADIGCLATSYQPGAFPVVEAVDLPLGWANSTVASVSLWDLVDKYKPKEFEKVKVLTMFTSPPANIMAMKPIQSRADLKGYTLRTPGTHAKFIELLGGSVVAMPMSDVPEGLQKGVIKGLLSSLEVLKDFKYAELTRHITSNANLFTVSFAVVMNKAKWDSLPADVKKVLDDLAKEQAIWTGQYVDNHVHEALRWSRETYKDFQVYHLSREELAEWSALLRPMNEKYIKDYEAKGLPARAIYEDVLKSKDKYTKEYVK